jgi:hypothetical protein
LQEPISVSVRRDNLSETIRELRTKVPVYSSVKPGSWIVPGADLARIEGPVEAPVVIGLPDVNLRAVCNELED